MGDKVTRLVVEIDPSGVSSGSKRMEADFTASVAKMDGAVKGTQRNVDGMGGSIQGIARHAATAGRVMSSAIGAATAATAASERQWLSLGTVILSSFAAGGPVAGGIAVVAAGIGLLASGADKAAERARVLGSAIAAWKTTAVDAGRAATAAFADFGISDSTALQRKVAQFQAIGSDAARFGNVAKSGVGSDAMLKVLGESLADADRAGAEGTAAGLAREKSLREQAEQLRKLIELTKALEAAERNVDMGRIRNGVEDRDKAATAQRAAMRAFSAGVEGVGAGAAAGGATAGALLANAQLRDQWQIRKDILAIEIQGDALRATANGEAANEIALLTDIALIEAQIHQLAGMTGEDAKKEVDALRNQVKAKRELLGVTKDVNAATADRNLDREIATAEALFAVDQRRVALAQKLDDLNRNKANDPAKVARLGSALEFANQFKADDPIRRELDLLEAITGERRNQVEIEQKIQEMRRNGVSEALVEEFRMAKAREPLIAFLTEASSTISQTLSGAIVDGLSTGFIDGRQVALQIVKSLLSQLLNSIVSSGLQAAFAGIFSAGGGGGGGGGFLATAFSAVTSAAGIGGGNQVGGTGGLSQIMEGIGGGGCAGGG